MLIISVSECNEAVALLVTLCAPTMLPGQSSFT